MIASYSDFAAQEAPAEQRAKAACPVGHKVVKVTETYSGRTFTTYEIAPAHVSFEWMGAKAETILTK